MTNKTLTKLRQAIIKEIPEIVELKMGCEIIKDKITYKMISIIGEEDEWGEFTAINQKYTDVLGKTISINRNDDYDFEIIGRKITLADILSIVEMMYEDDKNKNAIPTSEIPEIKQVLNCWRFSRGDLENQSKLTINSLSKIILKGDE